MKNQERRTYQSATYKIENKRRRKERQRANRQRGYQAQNDNDDDEHDDSQWTNFSQQEWMDYQIHERRRQQQPKGRGLGHYSTG